VEMVGECLHRNAAMAKRIIAHVIPRLPAAPGWPCHCALAHAIMTDRKRWPAVTRRQLAPLLAKYT
jgi:5'-methylthioadenosine phosphorylase